MHIHLDAVKAPTIALAGSLLLATPVFANSGHGGHADRTSFREMRALNPAFSGKELRQMMRVKQTSSFAPHSSGTANAGMNLNLEVPAHQVGVLQNNHVLAPVNFKNHSQLVNDNGKAHSVTSGLELDLTSDQRSIVLGQGLFARSSSYSIDSGGEEKVLVAGSKVSAAEYVALQQVIAGGAQDLIIDRSGRGVAGQFNLNSISDGGANLRAASLVIPESVLASGDFSRNADGLRVTNDLVNHGSIYAFSSNALKNTVRIAARDINNGPGGLISTDISTAVGNHSSAVNLSLRADRDINNAGAIISSGDLELSAGGSLNNVGTVRANGNVSILASNVTNGGVISSFNNNVNFGGISDANLSVNNAGGTISAANGAINIRSEQYNGVGNSTVTGGDLFSRELNLFAGQGTCDIFVNELTGVVQSTGSAVHVSGNTDTLTIGSQCLNGDPTYFNNGNIVIQNNIIVQEDLAIIASGDITTTATSLFFQTRDANGQGHNIFIVAGANITAGTGPVTGGNLPGQPPITENATGNVTIDGGTAAGGKVDLSNATVTLSISSSSIGSQQNGGDTLIAAFGGSNAGSGSVLLTSNSSIQALGTGQANNGNITVLAGGTSSKSIVLGDIFARNGTGTSAGTGNVTIINQLIQTSDGQPITFSKSGAITTSNTLQAFSLSGLGNGTLSVGNISTTTNVTVIGGGLTTVGAINAHSIFPSGDSGNVLIQAQNSAVQIGSIDIGAEGSGKAGSLTIQSSSDVVQSGIGQIDAFAGSTGSNGGTIDIRCFGKGGLALTGDVNTTAPGGIGGNVLILAGSGGTATLTASNVTVNAGGSASNGTIELFTGKIDIATKLILLANNSNQGGAISIGTSNGGIKTSGGDFTADSSSKISLDLSNLLIDANGVASAGGNVKLNAPLIIGTQAADPSITGLQITANGDNNSGGSIDFSAPGNIQLTTIGQNFIKIPKGPALALQLQAQADSNAAFGNGGSISVRVGGSILSGSDNINVNGFNGGDAGLIRLTAGLAAPKKGATVVVEGSLFAEADAGGDGGQILLTSASKTTFVMNSFKAPPKNGTMFTIFVSGNTGTGLLSIKNELGGIQVAQNKGFASSGVIAFSAGGKGRILSAKNTSFFGDTVEVNSDLGDINLEFVANQMEFNTNAGDVTLRNDNVGNSVLISSLSGGGTVTINNGGGLTIGGDLTANGDTALVAAKSLGGGTLSVTSNITVNNGGLILQNLDTANGDINFNNGLTVQTTGKGDDVAIVIGAVPKKPLNPSPPFAAPAQFTVNPTGKGQVFFGQNPALITTPATNVTLNATNKNVILNNASTGGKFINLGDNNVITADPPSRPSFTMPVLNGSSSFSAGTIAMVGDQSIEELDTHSGLNLTSGSAITTTALPTDVATIRGTVPVTFEPVAASNQISQGDGTTGAFVWSDDDLGLNSAAMIGRTNATTSGDSKIESAFLRNGAILFAPSKRTEIETPFGIVMIDKGAIAFVVIDENKLAVYDLHDNGRGAVSLSTRSLNHQLVPGRCVVISNRVQHHFENFNPMEAVGYRNVSTHVGNGLKSVNAEFSTPHVINCIAPLQAVLHGKNEAAKRMCDRLMKTTAVLLHLGANKEPFRIYAEPNVTAMN